MKRKRKMKRKRNNYMKISALWLAAAFAVMMLVGAVSAQTVPDGLQMYDGKHLGAVTSMD
jgi:hypothetical protein